MIDIAFLLYVGMALTFGLFRYAFIVIAGDTGTVYVWRWRLEFTNQPDELRAAVYGILWPVGLVAMLRYMWRHRDLATRTTTN